MSSKIDLAKFKAARATINANQPAVEPKEPKKTMRQLPAAVEGWLEAHSAVWSPVQQTFRGEPGKLPKSPQALAKRISSELRREGYPSSASKVGETLTELGSKFEDATEENLRTTLTTPLTTDQIREGIETVYAILSLHMETVREEDVAAVRHWVWQVKRALLDLERSDHLMLIAFGEQGCGKSRLIKRLLTPIETRTITGRADLIKDRRNWKAIERSYVAFFDEMGGFDTRHLSDNKRDELFSTVKMAISGDVLTAHENHADSRGYVFGASFIGASNWPLNTLFQDSTGMRRFWELKFLPEAVLSPKFPEINKIINDPEQIQRFWNCIHQNDPSPLADEDMKRRVKAIQGEKP